MSESNRQRATGLVQAYYEAFNRGDWDAMLAFLAETSPTTSTRVHARSAGRPSPASCSA